MPLHPIFVHLPISLALIAPFFTLGLILWIVRDSDRPRSWLIIIAGHFLLTIFIYAAMALGEADQTSAAFPGALKKTAENHADFAQIFFLLSIAGIPLSLLGYKKRSGILQIRYLIVFYQILLLAACVRTAHLGGIILHGGGWEKSTKNAPGRPPGPSRYGKIPGSHR